MGFLSAEAFLLTFCVLGIVQIAVAEGDISVAGSEVSGDGALNPLSAARLLSFSPAFETHKLAYYFSLSLSSTFPEDLEVSDYCMTLLRIFGERCVEYVKCLVSYARPVKICEKCYAANRTLQEIYKNISYESTDPGSVNCYNSLVRSDRLMLVYMLYSSLDDIWDTASCSHCLTPDQQNLSNDTLYFFTALNRSLNCFDKHRQGNHSELCKECKAPYQSLSELYNNMEKNHTLCIDLEDVMNVTRRLWSKDYGCSVPREETVPVIAVSGFMLFLPIIFYLSSFLHSEQKKRKLIHPKRVKSHHNFMNIQEKFS